MKSNCFILLFLLAFGNVQASAQAFISEIEDEDIGVILNNPTIVTLVTGEELTGKMSSASLINGYLTNITLKFEDGTKRKLKPSEVTMLKVKASKLAKLSMINEAGSSIKELVNTDFDQIINREYIIFEQALRATKKDKPALMQLLNPGFDSQIKVFTDPNARESGGLTVNDVVLTGGQEKSYLFVKHGAKAVIVRKGSYRRNFDELYADCQKMIEVFTDDRIKFKDMPAHVFVYDQVCSTPN